MSITKTFAQGNRHGFLRIVTGYLAVVLALAACGTTSTPAAGLSLVGFSSSRLLSHTSLGLGVLLFGNRGPGWPRFRHEAAQHQPSTADQPADNRDDATGKTTQHAWARTFGGGATRHMGLGQGLQTACGQGRIDLAAHTHRPQRRGCNR